MDNKRNLVEVENGMFFFQFEIKYCPGGGKIEKGKKIP